MFEKNQCIYVGVAWWHNKYGIDLLIYRSVGLILQSCSDPTQIIRTHGSVHQAL